MARTRRNTRATGKTRKTTTRSNSPTTLPPAAEAPKRGVKLKHVSTFTMLVALLCLFAYLAGRVDVSAATSVASRGNGENNTSLGPNFTSQAKESSMILGLRTAKYEVQD